MHTPGFVEFADMPALYTLARALVFPSRYESFGIPIVEAMACGCPVITATTSACPEVAGDAALLVDPDDVEGLAGGHGAGQPRRLDLAGRAAAPRTSAGRRIFPGPGARSTLLSELRTAAGVAPSACGAS